MMNNNINIQTTEAILEGITTFIKQARLDQNKSQSELAELAGIDRTTLGQFENGTRSISLTTLIQLLRALNRLDVLAHFKVETTISPIQLAEMEARKRKRASKAVKNTDIQPPSSDW